MEVEVFDVKWLLDADNRERDLKHNDDDVTVTEVEGAVKKIKVEIGEGNFGAEDDEMFTEQANVI